jgi:flagellar protein FlaG
MASGIMSEAILIIASVIIATSVAGVVMSQVGVFQSTFTATTEGQKNTLLTNFKIVMATNTTNSNVAIWVKNIGQNPIHDVGKVDVYYGQVSKVQSIPYSQAVQNNLSWKYDTIPNPVWQIMDTFSLNITDTNLQKNATYQVTIITPNGVSDEHIFSLP